MSYHDEMDKKALSNEFGAALRRIRNDKGMTQDALAEKLEINSPYISRLESGQKHPSLEMIWKLAKAMGIKASDIIKAVEDRERT